MKKKFTPHTWNKKLQKLQPEKKKAKKKSPTISLEDEPLSITNIVVRIWNVTDAMLTIKWHEHVGLAYTGKLLQNKRGCEFRMH